MFNVKQFVFNQTTQSLHPSQMGGLLTVMFMKRREYKDFVGIRMPVRLLQQIDELAHKIRKTRSFVILHILEEYFKQQKPQKPLTQRYQIIKCPSCGAEYSSKFEKCPQCGR